MKTFELKPTDENILNTYLSDSIGRNKEVLQFVNILNSIDGSCAIALEGKWGSGKTFFVKQVELVLNANNDFTSFLPKEKKGQIRQKQQLYLEPGQSIRPYVSVYYDSWANDSDNDPALSLVYTIMQASVYKGYKRDKIEKRGDRAEMSDFPLYLNTVAGGLDRRDQTIGGFSFVVKIYAVPVVEIIG